MADNFHGEIPSRINGSKQVHNPREFDTANSGDRGWKDEKGNFTWTLNNLLPSALDIVDNTAVPPTEVDGDIYIIDSTGASHSDWDSAAANSWVRYNSTDDLWNEIGAVQGLLCYIEDVDEYFDFNGTTWAAIAGAGGGGNTIYSANDSLTGARTVSLSGNSLTFQGATPLLSIDGTDGTSSAVLSINNSTGSGGNAGFVLQSGAVSKWAFGNNHVGGGTGDEFVIATGSLDTAHKLVISQAGNVGIGTNVPARKVEIAVASGVTQALRLTRDSNTVNNGVVQTFALDDSGGTPTEYAFIAGGIITNTDGAEEGFLKFDTIRAGAIDFSAGDPTMMLRNKKVGIGIIPVSVLDVKSTGATSSTFSFRAASAGDSNLFTCRDDGKIGIGTAAPTEKLHVVGSIKMVDTNEGAGKVLTSDVNGVGSWATPAGGAGTLDATLTLGNTSEGQDIIINAVDTVSDGGFNDSPALRLRGTYDSDITAGVISSDYDATFRNDMLTAGASPTSKVLLNIGSSDLFAFTSAGRLGVGILSPNYRLDVAENVGAISTRINVRNSTSTSLKAVAVEGQSAHKIQMMLGGSTQSLIHTSYRSKGSIITSGVGDINMRFVVAQSTSGNLFEWVTDNSGLSAPSEKMVMDSAGNLGIGTALPTSKLHVVGTSLFQLDQNAFTYHDKKNLNTGTLAGSQTRWWNANGRVAVGVYGSGFSSPSSIQNFGEFRCTSGIAGLFIYSGNPSGEVRLGVSVSNNTNTTDGNALLINGSRQVGIGSGVTSISGSHALEVTGSTNLIGTMAVSDDANFDSNTLFVDASESRVGIGTASPTSKLHVVGDVLVTSNMDAVTYSVNGAAGANFSGAVTNITVVDGIVTAVS